MMRKHYESPLDRAIASKDPQLFKTNVANIVGHALKGRPVTTINRAIVAVMDIILPMMEQNKSNGKNTGGYIFTAIRREAIRFVMNPINRQGQEVQGWQQDHIPDVEKHKVTVAEWLLHAKTDEERDLLIRLHGTANALTYERKRFAELRQSQKRLVDQCAQAVGLSHDEALACFQRVANETIPDDILASAKRSMDNVTR